MSGIEWQIGDLVLVRGRPWTIRDADGWVDCTLLRLATPTGRGLTRGLLIPFDRPRRLARPHTTRVLRPRRWLHELRRIAVDQVPFGGAIAAAGAALKLLPHQLEPLLAVLRHGATRLLIADAVGLGKTIQAGLILLELAARTADFRAIVLVPAALREQWSEELLDHFALDVAKADAGWLRSSTATRAADINPWSLPGIYLASLDFVKRAEVLRGLEDITWDLTVVDEAHLATLASDRRAAAHAVASRSRRVVLLTATPDLGDPAPFAALYAIGAVDPAAPPALFFRRTRAEVVGGQPRRSVLLRVRPTVAEQRMHDLLERYSRLVWQEAGRRGDARAKLATIVLRKRALSSAASLAVSAQRRLDLLTGVVELPERQLLLPLTDEDPLGDDVDDDDLAAPGLTDPRREQRWLASIAEAARQASRSESKSARLLRWLARVSEPIIVFTEYRDTLNRLERLIRGTGRQVASLHGGLERMERSRVQRMFNAGGLTLLATDAAAEGLNLHRHCRIVVHYELPWRPARIEQRVGRVDRLGQARRVHEIALVATGTVERLVLAPLAIRAARARAAGAAASGLLDSLSESAVSDLVMSGAAVPAKLASGGTTQPTVRIVDFRAEAAAEVARLETVRAWLARSARRGPASHRSSGTIISTARRRQRGLEPGLVLVFSLILTEADGRRVHEDPLVLHLAASAGWQAGKSAHSRRLVVQDALALSQRPGTLLHDHLAQALQQTIERVEDQRTVARQESRRREEELRFAQPSAARQMIQAGLFDRRAVVGQARRDSARDARLQEVATRLRSLDQGASVIGRADLVAVLFVPGGAT